MAKNILQRALTTVPNDGFARAKKVADLAVKTNTDDAGAPTAYGYELAIAAMQPYMDNIDAQRKVAEYSNALDKLNKKQKDQTETVSAFKLQESESYFTSFDGDDFSFRNPGYLISETSEGLDELELAVLNAIDEKQARGDSTDQLENYYKDLAKRSSAMRDLRNKYERGELTGATLDGFGYFVDSNPIDGSIRGAAILPVNFKPEGVGEGFRRLESTTNINGGMLPVYAPTNTTDVGDYVARIGSTVYSGSKDGALGKQSDGGNPDFFTPGGFSLADAGKFSVKVPTIEKGSFGQGYVGRDASGNPVKGTYYRGADGKLYQLDEATLEGFKQDPILSSRLNGYIPQFSPTEMKNFMKEAQQMPADRLPRESRMLQFQDEAAAATAEAERWQNMGFFDKLGEGFKGIMGGRSFEEVGNQAGKQALMSAIPGAAATSFFMDRVNRQNKPDQAATSSSTPDIIEQGKSFFRSVGDKVGSFFGR